MFPPVGFHQYDYDFLILDNLYNVNLWSSKIASNGQKSAQI